MFVRCARIAGVFIGLCGALYGLVWAQTALLDSSAQSACFSDADLAKAITDSQRSPVVLYIWSPRMLLSVTHAHEVQEQAQLAGLRFVPLRDARVPSAEWWAALARAGDAAQGLNPSQALCSARLEERDALRHFPTAFVLRNGALLRDPVVGAMPAAFWRSSLQQRLEQR